VMHVHRDRTITDETLVLDETGFYNCALNNCVIKYNGGEFVVENSPMHGCKWEFAGSAENTIGLLAKLGVLHDFPVSGWVGGTVTP